MSLIRTGHTPDAWRDEGPNRAYSPTGRHDARSAAIIGSMRPVIKGTVLSVSRDRTDDDAHTKADARLRARYSIRPENRR